MFLSSTIPILDIIDSRKCVSPVDYYNDDDESFHFDGRPYLCKPQYEEPHQMEEERWRTEAEFSLMHFVLIESLFPKSLVWMAKITRIENIRFFF